MVQLDELEQLSSNGTCNIVYSLVQCVKAMQCCGNCDYADLKTGPHPYIAQSCKTTRCSRDHFATHGATDKWIMRK